MDFQSFDTVVDIILQDSIDSKDLLRIFQIYENNMIFKRFNICDTKFNIKDYFDLLKTKYKYISFDISNIEYLYDNNTSIYYNINQHNFINFYNFTNLKTINLNYSYGRYIDDKSINKLYNLEELILKTNKSITDKGIINLNKLKIIHLNDNTNITNKSLINKIDLEDLVLIHNKNINDEGFINITKLKKLNLGYNNNRKLNLDFIKNNIDLKNIIIYKKKNIAQDIIDIINSINNFTYKINIL